MIVKKSERQFAVMSCVGEDTIGFLATGSTFLRLGKSRLARPTDGLLRESAITSLRASLDLPDDDDVVIYHLSAATAGNLFGVQFFFHASPESMRRISRTYKVELKNLNPHLVMTAEPTMLRDDKAMHYELSLYANDKPGIVSELCSTAARYGVNFASMAAGTYSAPFSGDSLFVINAKLDIPSQSQLSAFCAALAIMTKMRGYDIDIRPEVSGGSDDAMQAVPVPFPPNRLSAYANLTSKDEEYRLADQN